MKRTVKAKDGRLFNGFVPGMSHEARCKISETIRSWRIGKRSDLSLEQISDYINPVLRGWVNYYGAQYKHAFNSIRKQFHLILVRWATRKYKHLRNRRDKASGYIYSLVQRDPKLFYFWEAFYESNGK